jgi:hypothetical protein
MIETDEELFTSTAYPGYIRLWLAVTLDAVRTPHSTDAQAWLYGKNELLDEVFHLVGYDSDKARQRIRENIKGLQDRTRRAQMA